MALDRSFKSVLQWLRRESNLAVDRALLEALPVAPEGARADLLDAIIERQQPVGLRALMRDFSDLPGDVQDLMLAQAPRLRPACAAAFADGDKAERLATVEWIVRADAVDLAGLLADGLAHEDEQVKESCASGLRTLVLRRVATGGGGERPTHAPASSAERRPLAAALERAIHLWELHFRPEILDGCMRLATWLAPALERKTGAARNHFLPALGQALMSAEDVDLAPFCFIALGMEGLRTFAVRCLERQHPSAFAEALLRAAYMLKDPRIRVGMRQVRTIPWLAGRLEFFTARDPRLAFRLLDVVYASGLSQARKHDFCRQVQLGGVAALQHASLWHIVEDPAENAERLLREWAGDREPAVQKIAARELDRRRPEEARRRRFRTPCGVHTSSAVCAPISAPRAVVGSPGLSDNPRAGVDALTLRAELADANPHRRMAALKTLQASRTSPGFADLVPRLTHDPDPAVRATAVGLLRELPAQAGLRLLCAALADEDPRVQANALDALIVHDHRETLPLVVEKLTSPVARVRANAVCALLPLNAEQAGETLLGMLEDDRRSWRLSALWAVGSMRLRSLGERVARLGREDADALVRRRANAVLLDLTRPSSHVDLLQEGRVAG